MASSIPEEEIRRDALAAAKNSPDGSLSTDTLAEREIRAWQARQPGYLEAWRRAQEQMQQAQANLVGR